MSTPAFRRLLVVIKQTAWEEYSQLRARGQAPKALRWKRLESRFHTHQQCVNDLVDILKRNNLQFSCVNRVELDRQHLADVDLVIAVGGDGTCLSAAHFLDHGTIPLLGINSDPMSEEHKIVKKKKTDERTSHGALCACTAANMKGKLPRILHGGGILSTRSRIQCIVKSTFSETRLVPALNDLLIANPSPAAVSRFRMGLLKEVKEPTPSLGSMTDPSYLPKSQYGTVTRFGGKLYDVDNSLNVWSSGLWVSTGTGSSAAMAAAGGMPMDVTSDNLQYLIREHMIENAVNKNEMKDQNNALLKKGEKLHLRWNSQKGRIFIDGSHLYHNLELGDEILIDADAPPLALFTRDD
ncbi:NADH kinase [Skeletonema marinoi]|uniref:NADH kinase n=1 Tax=Skeletonema marinoi TaxID=267567 RepID=A0AAD9DIG0_9STRA|nr:NADH kinase [Skeletonema marinoi]|mmetsp:Transcript_21785/g.43632  ORF Transcript_21785/g.43632 Transcript_21785/m.43632 type:complete len:353 (+) Transcript_21785:220-1278(+)